MKVVVLGSGVVGVTSAFKLACKQFDHVGDDTAVLDETGVAYEVLDPAGCVQAEPALALTRDRIVGGLRLPGDETGDAHQFTSDWRRWRKRKACASATASRSRRSGRTGRPSRGWSFATVARRVMKVRSPPRVAIA